MLANILSAIDIRPLQLCSDRLFSLYRQEAGVAIYHELWAHADMLVADLIERDESGADERDESCADERAD